MKVRRTRQKRSNNDRNNDRARSLDWHINNIEKNLYSLSFQELTSDDSETDFAKYLRDFDADFQKWLSENSRVKDAESKKRQLEVVFFDKLQKTFVNAPDVDYQSRESREFFRAFMDFTKYTIVCFHRMMDYLDMDDLQDADSRKSVTSLFNFFMKKFTDPYFEQFRFVPIVASIDALAYQYLSEFGHLRGIRLKHDGSIVF